MTINGSNYYSKVIDGVAKFNITGLNAGNHTAYITYEGDSNYLENETEVNLTVTKLTTNINITSDNVTVVGHPVVFTIETSANLTEVIRIEIINRDSNGVVIIENTFVENGKGSFVAYNLEAGNYTAYAYFLGDERYDAVDNNTNFTVSGKSPVSLTVEVKNITLGEDATVYVNVTGALNGKVTLNVAD